jgi:hypothetical protein
MHAGQHRVTLCTRDSRCRVRATVGQLEEIEEIWLEVEMVLCGGRGESVAIRISVNLIIWYSVAPS